MGRFGVSTALRDLFISVCGSNAQVAGSTQRLDAPRVALLQGRAGVPTGGGYADLFKCLLYVPLYVRRLGCEDPRLKPARHGACRGSKGCAAPSHRSKE